MSRRRYLSTDWRIVNVDAQPLPDWTVDGMESEDVIDIIGGHLQTRRLWEVRT